MKIENRFKMASVVEMESIIPCAMCVHCKETDSFCNDCIWLNAQVTNQDVFDALLEWLDKHSDAIYKKEA